MKPPVLIFLLFLGIALAEDTPAPASPVSDALFRVQSNNQSYDFFQPWSKKPPVNRRGVGVVVENDRVLVTAELVANSTFIELEHPVTGDKSAATLERVDYEVNLAVLRADKPEFLSQSPPLPLNGPARVGDLAEAVQFEANGGLARTQARLTSIATAPYPVDGAVFLLYKAALPLQQRDGSFTIPLLRDGHLLGLVMRYDARNQTADIVPGVVIRRFLEESAKPGYAGFPRLGMSFSDLRDPQLRRHLRLEESGGVLLTDITPHASAESAGLRKGDVILAVNGIPLDQDGHYEDTDHGRITFSHLTNTLTPPSTAVPVTILRDGKKSDLAVTMRPLDRNKSVIPSHHSDSPPGYLVAGGLVFIELSRAYLREWGPNWSSTAPQRLVHYDAFPNDLPRDRGRLVILSQVLPTADSIGYEHLENLVVTKVNGQEIRSLKDLSKALSKPVNGFHRIECEEDPKILFLDAASVEKNRDTLRDHYSLPALERL